MAAFEKFIRNIFAYETPKIVTIRHTYIGIFSRLLQLAIILYIVVYLIIYQKGYQATSDIESAVTTKVKGVAFTNFSDAEFNPELKNKDAYRRIWDAADYVIPPSESNSVFIATNINVTPNQKRSICPEDITVKGARCDPHRNKCVARSSLVTGNGVLTGRCVPFDGSGNFSCEIHAWCPVENDILPLLHQRPLLEASENFTILIKNYVFFPKFKNSNMKNIREHRGEFYLQNCHYDPVKQNDCPVFKVGDIIAAASPKSFAELASKGAVIEIRIIWNCDLDWNKEYCFPIYNFVELDDPKIKLAKGWNFRYADYFNDETRTLHKMYGLKFTISVQGQAGQFRVLPLFLHIGAGVGLLVLQRILCDIIVLNFVNKRSYYKSKKYENVLVESDEIAVGINSPDPHSRLLGASLDAQTDSSIPERATDTPSHSQTTEKISGHSRHVVDASNFYLTTGKPSHSSHHVTGGISNLHPTTGKPSSSSHHVTGGISNLHPTTGKTSIN